MGVTLQGSVALHFILEYDLVLCVHECNLLSMRIRI